MTGVSMSPANVDKLRFCRSPDSHLGSYHLLSLCCNWKGGAAYSISKECATVWKYLLLVCHRLTVYPLLAEKDTSVVSPYISNATTVTLNVLHKTQAQDSIDGNIAITRCCATNQKHGGLLRNCIVHTRYLEKWPNNIRNCIANQKLPLQQTYILTSGQQSAHTFNTV